MDKLVALGRFQTFERCHGDGRNVFLWRGTQDTMWILAGTEMSMVVRSDLNRGTYGRDGFVAGLEVTQIAQPLLWIDVTHDAIAIFRIPCQSSV